MTLLIFSIVTLGFWLAADKSARGTNLTSDAIASLVHCFFGTQFASWPVQVSRAHLVVGIGQEPKTFSVGNSATSPGSL
jgi:hypothetical protein